MAKIIGLKEETEVLFISGLLLLTAKVISGNSQLARNSPSDEMIPQHQRLICDNHNWLSQKYDVMDFVLIPVPETIAKLACLAGASMQKQLDSAMSWPTGLPQINETIIDRDKIGINLSSIIKNPLNFREMLKQISQQLSKALKTIYANSVQMSTKMEEAQMFEKKANKWFEDTHALNDYLTRSTELDTFIKLISEQLKDLNIASKNVVLLSSSMSTELKELAKSVKVLEQALYDMQSAKQQYLDSVLNIELYTKNNLKNKLEKEVNSLKQENKKLNNNLAKSETKFYRSFDRYLIVTRKHKKNPKVRTCLENVAKNWNTTDEFHITCGGKSSWMERKNLRAAIIAKFTWKTFHKALKENKDDLGQNEVKYSNLSLAVQLLERTKHRMEQDISFLDITTESIIEKLENQMEDLIIKGWNKVVSLCTEIQEDVLTIKASIMSYKRLVNFRSSVPTEEVLQQTKQQFIKTAKKMSLIGRILSVYLLAYNSDLYSLVFQLERMTNSNENLAELEENLINACNNTSREFETFLAKLKLED